MEGDGREVPAPAAAAVMLLCVICAGISFQVLAGNAYLRKAGQFNFFKNTAQAERYSAKAYAMSPWNEENAYFAGLFAERNGSQEGAIKMFERAAALNPGHWEASLNLFNAYTAYNRNEEALAAALNLYRISPYSRRAITAAGYMLYINNRADDAAEIYERGVRYFPYDYDILYQASAVFGAAGDTGRVVEYAKRAIEASRDNSGAYYNLAVAYYKRNELEDAGRVIGVMLERFPDAERFMALKKAVEDAAN